MERMVDTLEPIEFECPRCEAQTSALFYGPCESCFSELRATYQSEATELVKTDYEPKMNVTPNAVALKDD